MTTGTALAIADDQQQFSKQQVAALAQLGVERASDADLAVFFHQCKRTGLDPFSRQIYMISRRKRVKDPATGIWRDGVQQTIQTGIDGFRLIAARAANARGATITYEDTLWADSRGGWHDKWIWQGPPHAAKVTIRIGEASVSGVASTHEYMPMNKAGEPTGLWKTMPATMIAKCAEALALRKAFPMDLSGLYTSEEMNQADARETITATPPRGVQREQQPAKDTPPKQQPPRQAPPVDDGPPPEDTPPMEEPPPGPDEPPAQTPKTGPSSAEPAEAELLADRAQVMRLQAALKQLGVPQGQWMARCRTAINAPRVMDMESFTDAQIRVLIDQVEARVTAMRKGQR